MPPELQVTSRKVKLPGGQSAVVVDLAGSVDANTAVEFEEGISRLIDIGVPYLFVSCRRLEYINSTGMGLFIKFSDQLAERQGSLELVNVPENILQLFSLLGLESLFRIHESEKAAVRSIIDRARGDGAAPAPKPDPPSEKPRKKKARKKSAPAEDDPFPLTFSCTSCNKRLSVAAPGYFRCPTCGVFFTASSQAKVKAYHTLEPRRLEITFPVGAEYIEPLRQAVRALATGARLSDDDVDRVDAAVDEACSIVVRKAGGTGACFETLAVADERELVIAIKMPGRRFQMEGKDPLGKMSLRIIQESMDSLQFFDVPGKGQIAKMTKRLR